MTEMWLETFHTIVSSFLVICGIIIIIFSARYSVAAILRMASGKNFKMQLDSQKLSELLYEQRILIKGPKIVTIGGGTGLSTLLRGLKQYSSNITAVVTVADDGGGSGTLREELGILPPGDIRNCVLALANTEPIMNRLLQYRFDEGNLKGQSFGNLFLAAMNGISGTFEDAVKKMSEVLAVTGRVLPVTNSNINLEATLSNGTVKFGESNIGSRKDDLDAKIKEIRLCPKDVRPLKEVMEAIEEADIIVMGPGSLYTSILPNLLVDGVAKQIIRSKALKVYICNVMTQPGETLGYTVSEHIQAIEDHTVKGIIDCCFVNNKPLPDDVIERYKEEGAEMVVCDHDKLREKGIEIFEGEFARVIGDAVRHNAAKVSMEIMNLVADKVLKSRKDRAIDYYYLTKEKNV